MKHVLPLNTNSVAWLLLLLQFRLLILKWKRETKLIVSFVASVRIQFCIMYQMIKSKYFSLSSIRQVPSLRVKLGQFRSNWLQGSPAGLGYRRKIQVRLRAGVTNRKTCYCEQNKKSPFITLLQITSFEAVITLKGLQKAVQVPFP